jgi:uncharacterized protein (TIGR00369 family)
MAIPDRLRDEHGQLPPGAMAILADSVLGAAIMSTVDRSLGMATSHMHLELLDAVGRDVEVVQAEGEQRSFDEKFALAEGALTLVDGTVVAKATIGAVLLKPRVQPQGAKTGPGPGTPPGTTGPSGGTTGGERSHRLVAGSPVLETLRARILTGVNEGVSMLVEARPDFANSSGGVQGGFGVLMGERALDVALQAALGDERSMRPVELRAAFLRPIPADGETIECHATVMHLGRRLAATRGEVRDQGGRPAVLVDATYIAV